MDLSQEMLDKAERKSAGIDLDIDWLQGSSCETGIPDAGLTLVTSFNSFHHFPLEGTLAEVERILRPGQYFAIYIRTHEQEEEHVWGRWFPDYLQHTIVPSTETLRSLAKVRSSFSLEVSKNFSFERHASLDRILQQTRSKHYSTLSLYRPEAFDEGLIQFENNLRSNYPDPLRISYPSSYGLFLYRVS